MIAPEHVNDVLGILFAFICILSFLGNLDRERVDALEKRIEELEKDRD